VRVRLSDRILLQSFYIKDDNCTGYFCGHYLNGRHGIFTLAVEMSDVSL